MNDCELKILSEVFTKPNVDRFSNINKTKGTNFITYCLIHTLNLNQRQNQKQNDTDTTTLADAFDLCSLPQWSGL